MNITINLPQLSGPVTININKVSVHPQLVHPQPVQLTPEDKLEAFKSDKFKKMNNQVIDERKCKGNKSGVCGEMEAREMNRWMSIHNKKPLGSSSTKPEAVKQVSPSPVEKTIAKPKMEQSIAEVYEEVCDELSIKLHPEAPESFWNLLAKETPMALTTPVALTTPIVPTTPVALTTSIMPVTTPIVPTTPVTLTTPIVPVTTPVALTTPIVPTTPVALTTPIVPTTPVALTTPIVPTTPVALTTPIVPTTPITLTTPIVPTNTPAPTTPIVPVDTSDSQVNSRIDWTMVNLNNLTPSETVQLYMHLNS